MRTCAEWSDEGLKGELVRRLLFWVSLLGLATPAEATWREARSAHFIVYSEDKPQALKEFATELERFDAAMRVLRGLPQTTDSPNNRLTIFQVSSIAAVQKILGMTGSNIAGVYNGHAGNSIAFVPRRTGGGWSIDAQTVLLHEYAHHFMYRNYPAAFPVWFSEGYAEFNSTARFVADGAVDLGLPAQHRAGGLFYLNPLPVTTLMEADTRRLSDDAREVLYGRGWLLTHYLSFAKEREGQLARYLLAINQGKSSMDAATQTFGDLRQLDRELDRYKQGRMAYLRVPASKIAIAPVEIRDLSEGASAIMPVMMRSRRGVDEEAAKEVVQDARRLAAPYPDDPFVQLALAEAEIDAGHLAEADQAADRVLKAEPGNVRALVFKGRVAVARLKEAKSPSAEDWKQVRRWFVRANRAEPGAPDPLIEFYQSFPAEGVKPTPNAVEGLRASAALAPEDQEVRLMLGHQYLEDGKAAEARAALAPAAYSPHGGPVADFAGRVIAAVDSGGAAAGLKAWAEKPAKEEQAGGAPSTP